VCIFLSHIEEDRRFMQLIAEGLEASGYATWYFERDVLAGTSYLIQITDALARCDAIVLIASPHACRSDQVTREVVGAFERGKLFFPVLINMTPPEFKESQPEWRHALGGTAMITASPEDPSTAAERIIHGLKLKGIDPERAVSRTPRPIPHKTPGSPIRAQGERKNVTVMFADISGFTAMSEKMDPEEVTDLMNECFHFMGECVAQHGGTVDKYIGDCVMALFGAPRALEDAPHRAIEAALEMRNRLLGFNEDIRLNPPLSFHIGINTGPVIAGLVGGDKKQDFTVMGDTVNLASRMESAAQTGDILIAENTYRLVQGYFDCESIGPVAVKGKEQQVKAYRVLGHRRVITRIDACQGKGLSPFVGRDKELDHLKDRFEEIRASHGQVVGIVGEPGVGKSRLVNRFKESLPGKDFTFIEGGCIHFGNTIPYLPVLDMLRDYFDIMEDESEGAIKQKIRDRIIQLGSHITHILSPLSEVLSLKVDDVEYIKLDGKERRDRVFEAIRLLLITQSQQNPLVIIVEDLHWMDKTSEELLTFLINSLAAAKILLILLFRPEYNPAAWVTKTYYSQIRVDQLSRKTIDDLVKGILKGEEVERELIDFIAKRTEGNPLFIEEMTINLLENGAIRKEGSSYTLSLKPSDIQVPATVQGIIAARLDRLETELKGIMQTASVIGRDFAFRILQAVANLKEDLKSSMLTLQNLEFIYEKSIFPELEYIFKHALTQEVAYNSLLIKKRKEFHERVGQAIEEIYRDRIEEFYEMLAYHYSLSENPQKAYQYLKLSGDKAAKNYSNWEAVRFYKESMRMLDAQPPTIEIKRKKSEACFSALNPLLIMSYPEGTLDILGQAENLAVELDDRKNLATIYSLFGYYYTTKGNPLLALEYFEKCLREQEKIGAIESVAEIVRNLCASYLLGGDNAKAMEIGRRGLLSIEEHGKERDLFIGGINLYSAICGWCVVAAMGLGEFTEGRALFEKGLQNARMVNSKYTIGFLEFCYSTLAYWEGDVDNTVFHAKESLQIGGEAGADSYIGTSLSALGAGCYFLGDYETAVLYGKTGIEVQKYPVNLPWNHWHLAMVYLAREDYANALEHFETSLQLSLEYKVKNCEGVSRIMIGFVALKTRSERSPDAMDQIGKGFEVLEERNMKTLIAFGHLHLGILFADSGRKDDALESLNKAETMYLEMNVTPRSYWLTCLRKARAKLETMP
jgi:class 3 adenylate cyclase/tetratricopeptide (TPR) repeat protein